MKTMVKNVSVILIEMICAIVCFITMMAFGLFIAALFGRI